MTLNLNTEITTAARRIQRQVNGAPQAVMQWFDLDGNFQVAHEADMQPTDLVKWHDEYPGAKVSFVGGTWSQRRIQDCLDATRAFPEDGWRANLRLMEIEEARWLDSQADEITRRDLDCSEAAWDECYGNSVDMDDDLD